MIRYKIDQNTGALTVLLITSTRAILNHHLPKPGNDKTCYYIIKNQSFEFSMKVQQTQILATQ